ncbi:MAG: riboflavin synthase [Flavobacteriales bacterium]|nr:riboflavin synthase [Flavobacteriales bacterium]MCB9449386.1 riboflavin synthase [Flavobacteriales bacterium]
MFTGIIKSIGKVVSLQKKQGNLEIGVESDFTEELHVDQSIAHNGVCLTVTRIEAPVYYVEAIAETRAKTNLGYLSPGSRINLERCLMAGDRLDGHFVQGHVDTTAMVENIRDDDGSWVFQFACKKDPAGLLVPKGSVTVNGISLTLVEVTDRSFSVAIIPYTFEHTNLSDLKQGDEVNIEFDVLGKYVRQMLQASGRI